MQVQTPFLVVGLRKKDRTSIPESSGSDKLSLLRGTTATGHFANMSELLCFRFAEATGKTIAPAQGSKGLVSLMEKLAKLPAEKREAIAAELRSNFCSVKNPQHWDGFEAMLSHQLEEFKAGKPLGSSLISVICDVYPAWELPRAEKLKIAEFLGLEPSGLLDASQEFYLKARPIMHFALRLLAGQKDGGPKHAAAGLFSAIYGDFKTYVDDCHEGNARLFIKQLQVQRMQSRSSKINVLYQAFGADSVKKSGLLFEMAGAFGWKDPLAILPRKHNRNPNVSSWEDGMFMFGLLGFTTPINRQNSIAFLLRQYGSGEEYISACHGCAQAFREAYEQLSELGKGVFEAAFFKAFSRVPTDFGGQQQSDACMFATLPPLVSRRTGLLAWISLDCAKNALFLDIGNRQAASCKNVRTITGIGDGKGQYSFVRYSYEDLFENWFSSASGIKGQVLSAAGENPNLQALVEKADGLAASRFRASPFLEQIARQSCMLCLSKTDIEDWKNFVDAHLPKILDSVCHFYDLETAAHAFALVARLKQEDSPESVALGRKNWDEITLEMDGYLRLSRENSKKILGAYGFERRTLPGHGTAWTKELVTKEGENVTAFVLRPDRFMELQFLYKGNLAPQRLFGFPSPVPLHLGELESILVKNRPYLANLGEALDYQL